MFLKFSRSQTINDVNKTIKSNFFQSQKLINSTSETDSASETDSSTLELIALAKGLFDLNATYSVFNNSLIEDDIFNRFNNNLTNSSESMLLLKETTHATQPPTIKFEKIDVNASVPIDIHIRESTTTNTLQAAVLTFNLSKTTTPLSKQIINNTKIEESTIQPLIEINSNEMTEMFNEKEIIFDKTNCMKFLKII